VPCVRRKRDQRWIAAPELGGDKRMGSVDGLPDAVRSSETKMTRASESKAPTALRKRATLEDAAARRRSPKAGHVWAAASRRIEVSSGGCWGKRYTGHSWVSAGHCCAGISGEWWGTEIDGEGKGRGE
jgi:hypothetical protein